MKKCNKKVTCALLTLRRALKAAHPDASMNSALKAAHPELVEGLAA